jgi:hypothetical protein
MVMTEGNGSDSNGAVLLKSSSVPSCMNLVHSSFSDNWRNQPNKMECEHSFMLVTAVQLKRSFILFSHKFSSQFKKTEPNYVRNFMSPTLG